MWPVTCDHATSIHSNCNAEMIHSMPLQFSALDQTAAHCLHTLSNVLCRHMPDAWLLSIVRGLLQQQDNLQLGSSFQQLKSARSVHVLLRDPHPSRCVLPEGLYCYTLHS